MSGELDRGDLATKAPGRFNHQQLAGAERGQPIGGGQPGNACAQDDNRRTFHAGCAG
jgi:hypothetical protein